MSWHDPKGPWSQRQKWRIRSLEVSVAMVLLTALGLFVMLWWQDVSTPLPGVGGLFDDLLLPFLLPVSAFAFVFLAFLVNRIRIERTVLKEVPRTEGHVCPRCRTGLPQTSEGTCPKCRSPFAESELQAYWVDYVLEPGRIRPWGRSASWPRKLIHAPHLLLRNFWLSFQVVYLLAAVLVMWWISGVSFTGALYRYLPLFLGISLLFFLYLQPHRQRTGRTQHCAACDYQRAPEGPNPERCPECGADWSRPGGVIVGTRNKRRRNLWLACGLSVVALTLLMLSNSARSGWVLRALPTRALIHDTTHACGFTAAEWQEIGRRQLTSEQVLQLARGLLEKRLREDYLNRTEGGWLWTQVSTAALPNELVQRYYQEMLDVWIDPPEKAKVGQVVQLSLGAEFRSSNPPRSIKEVVYFGGFYVDDEPAPLPLSGDRVHAEVPCHTYPILLDEYPIQARFQPMQAGPVRVRAVLYFAVLSLATGFPPAVQWHADGTATLPPNVLWSQRIALSKEIEIAE